MSKLNWVQVSGYAGAAANNFLTGHAIPEEFKEIDGPGAQSFATYIRWNYGIPAHTLDNNPSKGSDKKPSALLCEWFLQQYKTNSPRATQLTAKEYGLGNHQGFVVNLTMVAWFGNRKYLYNFHVKIEAETLGMADLISSGASSDLKAKALEAMFPPLTGST